MTKLWKGSTSGQLLKLPDGRLMSDDTDCCCCDCDVNGPTADFTYSVAGTSPCTIDFTDASTAGDCGTITGWEWKCGSTTISTSQNPTGVDLSSVCGGSDPWTISLTVTDSSGCTDTKSRPVTCTDCSTHVANFSWSTLTSGTDCTITFSNSSSTSGGILSYLWEFSDGTTSASASPVKVITDDYLIATLTVTWVDGCQKTVTKTAGCCAFCLTENLPDTITITSSGWTAGTEPLDGFNGAIVVERNTVVPYDCYYRTQFTYGGRCLQVQVQTISDLRVIFYVDNTPCAWGTGARAGAVYVKAWSTPPCLGTHSVPVATGGAVSPAAAGSGPSSVTATI